MTFVKLGATVSSPTDHGGGGFDILADGRIVVAYDGSAPNNQRGTGLQFLAADGEILSDQNSSADVQIGSGVRVVALAGGGFALTTQDFFVNVGADNVWLRTYDATGAAVSAWTMVNADQDGFQAGYAATATKTGGVYVGYSDTFGEATDYTIFTSPEPGRTDFPGQPPAVDFHRAENFDVTGRFLSSSATGAGPFDVLQGNQTSSGSYYYYDGNQYVLGSQPSSTHSTKPGDQRAGGSATLTGGAVAQSYFDESFYWYFSSGNNFTSSVRSVSVRLVTPAGVSTEIKVNTDANDSGPISFANASSALTAIALSNGGFAVMWNEQVNSISPVVTKLRYFNANGAALTDEIDVLTRPAEVEANVAYGRMAAVGLSGGRIAIAYEHNDGTNNSDVSIAVVANLGTSSTSFLASGGAGPQQLVGGSDLRIAADGTLHLRLNNGGSLGTFDFLRFADNAGGAAVLTGGDAGQTHDGGAAGDFIDGEGGDDTLNGLGGDDRLYGGAGTDTIEGGAGADFLSGGSGGDTVNGGDGDDVLTGGAGADQMNGGVGFDTVSYAGGAPGVTVNLTTGVGSGGDAQGDAFTSVEAIIGTAGLDDLTGAGGSNRLVSGGGGGTMRGLAGDDTFVGGDGADHMDGGTGVDTVTFAAALAGVTANLDLGLGAENEAQGDTYLDVETVIGSAFNDVLVGKAGFVNTLGGGSGADVIYGEGIDVVNGGAGADVLFGGQGGALNIDLAATSLETVWGSVVGDTLNASAMTGAAVLVGQGGADVMTGGAGNDFLYFDELDTIAGGAGTDWAVASLATTAVTLNMVATGVEVGWGSTFNDTITAAGATASAILAGDAGNDALTGGNAGDFLYGFGDNDTLNGGAGDDNLVGGSGTDTFLFGANWGVDIVWDWTNTNEKFNLAGSGATNFADLTVDQDFLGSGNALVSFGANQILVVGRANLIDATDFIFA